MIERNITLYFIKCRSKTWYYVNTLSDLHLKSKVFLKQPFGLIWLTILFCSSNTLCIHTVRILQNFSPRALSFFQIPEQEKKIKNRQNSREALRCFYSIDIATKLCKFKWNLKKIMIIFIVSKIYVNPLKKCKGICHWQSLNKASTIIKKYELGCFLTYRLCTYINQYYLEVAAHFIKERPKIYWKMTGCTGKRFCIL